MILEDDSSLGIGRADADNPTGFRDRIGSLSTVRRQSRGKGNIWEIKRKMFRVF